MGRVNAATARSLHRLSRDSLGGWRDTAWGMSFPLNGSAHAHATQGESDMDDRRQASEQDVIGEEHWTNKGNVRLFLWEKYVGEPILISRNALVEVESVAAHVPASGSYISQPV